MLSSLLPIFIWIDRIFECPQGAPAIFFSENEDGSIYVQFDCEHCKECPVRDRCPVTQRGRLTYTKEKAATARRKKEQQSPEFKDAYKIRSGIEATNSELNRAYGAKRVWTRGFNKSEFGNGLQGDGSQHKALCKVYNRTDLSKGI
jgi:hypothetical protein